MVITGSPSNDLESPEWLAARALVKAGGTLVVLMGFARIRSIVDSLMAGECETTIPAAVISRGTHPDQCCKTGNLGDIAEQLRGVRTPAILVIGEVVSLRNETQWTEFADKLQLQAEHDG